MNKLPSCRYDQWASTLLFLDLGLSHLSLLLAREGVYAPSVSRFTIGVSVGTVGLLVAVLVGATQRHRQVHLHHEGGTGQGHHPGVRLELRVAVGTRAGSARRLSIVPWAWVVVRGK